MKHRTTSRRLTAANSWPDHLIQSYNAHVAAETEALRERERDNDNDNDSDDDDDDSSDDDDA